MWKALILLILLSSSTYSQVIKKVDGEKVVVFSLQQAKTVNDTFYWQRNEIEKLRRIKPIHDTFVKRDTVIKQQVVIVEKEPKMSIEAIMYLGVQVFILSIAIIFKL